MASTILRNLYLAERAKGEPARHAWRNAIIRRKFEALEDAGYARIERPYDDDADLSWLDQDHYQADRGGRAYVKRMKQIARDEGCYGIVGEYRLEPESREWEHADSVWGFLGLDDVSDGYGTGFSAYGPDVMAATVSAFRDAWKEHVRGLCPACHGTGRSTA